MYALQSLMLFVRVGVLDIRWLGESLGMVTCSLPIYFYLRTELSLPFLTLYFVLIHKHTNQPSSYAHCCAHVQQVMSPVSI